MKRTKFTVQMKNQEFNEQNPVSVITFLTESKRVCDSSQIYAEAAVWVFREFTSCPALADIQMQLTLSSNDTNNDESKITSSARVASHILTRYATGALICKADKNNQNYKQGSSTQ